MLIVTAGLLAYSAILVLLLLPPEIRGPAWIILGGCTLAVIVRWKGRRLLTACGTAAWASARELEQNSMLHATTGLILGRIPAEGTPLGQAVRALFNRRLSARDACRAMSDSLSRRKRKQGHLVRLPQAVHTMAVAPTGVGKGVSCIIPFLLTCDESCVVVDFKGELALLTAEHRQRMGHRIVILDPFKVVTQ
jgi:type IV secretion system protein VirD4